MANKYGDQSPNDTSAAISENDSGLGSLATQEEISHQDLEERTLTEAIEAEADNDGSHSIHQESYDRELWRLEGKNVSKLTLKGIYGRSVSVSESTLTYSHGQEVPRERLEKVRNKGEGKSDEVHKIYNALADHLQGFDTAEDCYLLPIENGILISQKEITTSLENIPGFISVQLEPRRGKVFLEATVSQDRCITYRSGQQDEGGNFLVLSDVGSGCEGIVYKAMDVLTGDQFAVKKIEISKEMLHKNPFSAFLTLTGCEQTCRAYGVILDEADNCVYFLMELLEGKTLSDLLGDRNSPIGIPFAVEYTIDILKGLQYIHGKKMIHEDICEVNIMIVGPRLQRAIIIDNTGARNARSPKSRGYLLDIENAIMLLNNMLWNQSICSRPWKASDEDQDKFNKGTLEKLETILESLLARQFKYQLVAYKSPMTDKLIETLLQDLGEISKELEGPGTCMGSPYDSPGSSKDKTSNPSKDQRASTAELELMKEIEELKAEKEKSNKDWMEKLERQENQLAELRESMKQLSLQAEAMEQERAKQEASKRAKQEASEAKAKKAEQEAKRFKDLYENLKARKGLDMQGTADNNEDP